MKYTTFQAFEMALNGTPMHCNKETYIKLHEGTLRWFIKDMDYDVAGALVITNVAMLELEWEPYIPKPKLTEDEKVILRNLPKEYEWIARDENGSLYIYDKKPRISSTNNTAWRNDEGNDCMAIELFNHLFNTIKWEDKKPHNIKDLLKQKCYAILLTANDIDTISMIYPEWAKRHNAYKDSLL